MKHEYAMVRKREIATTVIELLSNRGFVLVGAVENESDGLVSTSIQFRHGMRLEDHNSSLIAIEVGVACDRPESDGQE